ncbi:MAG: CHAT domain-containing protein [Methylococcales bacterium]
MPIHCANYYALVQRCAGKDSAAVAELYSFILRYKTIGAELSALQRSAVLGGRHPHLRAQLDEYNTLSEKIVRSLMAVAGKPDPRLPEWQARKGRLEKELANQIPEMDLDQQMRGVDVKIIAQQLPADTLLIEYLKIPTVDLTAVESRGEKRIQPDRYIAFVVVAGAPEQLAMVDLGLAEAIDRLVMLYRTQLTARGYAQKGLEVADSEEPAEPESRATGVRLRALVLDPLFPSDGPWPAGTRLLIAPDGELSQLPFESLPVGDGQYFWTDYRVSYLGCGRDLLRWRLETSHRAGPPLVIADPDFDFPAQGGEPNGEPFGRLPASRKEGEIVAIMLRVPPWFGDQASKERLKRQRSPAILHIATHGFYLPKEEKDRQKQTPAWIGKLERLEDPLLRSCLAFAGANHAGSCPADADDGLLTAAEVMNMDLVATQLVVLSACETGLGEIQVGEGVLGLRRAFNIAGAGAIIMSLWKVSDLATAILMRSLYQNLLSGMDKDEALRSAQDYVRTVKLSELRRRWSSGDMQELRSADHDSIRGELDAIVPMPDASIPFAHPRYWGAFIIQGDLRPLTGLSRA